jgi:hypothetical protein
MPEDERTILDRIREFERTFEQNYQRKLTHEEERILRAAEEIIRQRLAGQSRFLNGTELPRSGQCSPPPLT